jgi:hypothetical protein
MKIDTSILLNDLAERTRRNIHHIQLLQQKSTAELNQRPGPDSWSALECIEHLNIYDRFYLPEIGRRISQSKAGAEPVFQSGLLGNYFANMMLPKDKVTKMRTLKKTNPIYSTLDSTALDTFLNGQHILLELLDESRAVSLNKTRCNISISRWIRLKLGDTFRFLIYHQQRHILQAVKASK